MGQRQVDPEGVRATPLRNPQEVQAVAVVEQVLQIELQAGNTAVLAS